jgi:hypothetical protein
MTFRDSLSGILYACAGDRTQYEETLDVLSDSVESYILHLTATALKVATDSSSLTFDDIIRALRCDPAMQEALEARAQAPQQILPLGSTINEQDMGGDFASRTAQNG